ncbi:MAG: hypothetical protein OEY66_10490 [Gammaproteobacteria bacterium]|nr:hypothetical protein [Gammaproteobacteria bacterium]
MKKKYFFYVLIVSFFSGCAAHVPMDNLDKLRPYVDEAGLSDIYEKVQTPLVIIEGYVYMVPRQCIVERQFGGDIETRSVGGDLETRNNGGDLETRISGGDLEARRTGGDLEARKSGGDLEDRKSGGDLEARKSGGDLEDRKSGGDLEARKSGGDLEARKSGGDLEGRNLGGDQNQLQCKLGPLGASFEILNLHNMAKVSFYDGGQLRKVEGSVVFF